VEEKEPGTDLEEGMVLMREYSLQGWHAGEHRERGIFSFKVRGVGMFTFKM
jgi:hypothetical protein